jgi:SSS family solute:Na+ symporter
MTCRADFNLAKMLHRGQYAVDANGNPAPVPAQPPRTLRELLGIDEHFTRGDKILAAAMFSYVMGWFVVFVVVSVWNIIHIWPDERWSNFWYYTQILLPIALGTVTSVWFSIGCVRDLRRLFRRLKTLQRNPDDDGRVPIPGDDAPAAEENLVRST